MRRLAFMIFAGIMMISCGKENDVMKISIFCDHVDEIARQEGISFREAAEMVRGLGYTGLDVSVGISAEKLGILDSLGFEHACAIAHIDFIQGEKPEECRQALDFMREHGYSRLLLVPGLLPEGADDSLVDDAYVRIALFAQQAEDEGFDLMVEDFDNPRSICFDTQALDRLFTAVPQMNHAFDTGNYLFCGDDVMETLDIFLDRVHHVHLKDRNSVGGRQSPAVGTGIAPVDEVISELLESGYDGWFTVEHYGSRNMLDDASTSISNVRNYIVASSLQ